MCGSATNQWDSLLEETIAATRTWIFPAEGNTLWRTTLQVFTVLQIVHRGKIALPKNRAPLNQSAGEVPALFLLQAASVEAVLRFRRAQLAKNPHSTQNARNRGSECNRLITEVTAQPLRPDAKKSRPNIGRPESFPFAVQWNCTAATFSGMVSLPYAPAATRLSFTFRAKFQVPGKPSTSMELGSLVLQSVAMSFPLAS